MENWIPSSYRCIYIIKLSKNPDIYEMIKPNINLLILDICELYQKLDKDPSLLTDICIINQLLNYQFKHKQCLIDLVSEELITFISIELTLISKIQSEKEHIEKSDYEILLGCFLFCIRIILETNNNIVESYLVHHIPTTLLTLYECEFTNISIKTNLNHIFRLLLGNKHAIIYLSSLLDEKTLSKIQIPLFFEDKTKLEKWSNIYKKMNDFARIDEVLDPITYIPIIIPCIIPKTELNVENGCYEISSLSSNEQIQFCDKNIF